MKARGDYLHAKGLKFGAIPTSGRRPAPMSRRTGDPTDDDTRIPQAEFHPVDENNAFAMYAHQGSSTTRTC
jgi:hypothetical protein